MQVSHVLKAPSLAALATVLFAGAALASDPSITSCPSSVTTDANGNFSFDVEVHNDGNPGVVFVNAEGSSNISGIEVTSPPDYPPVIDHGDSRWYHVSGHMDGASGTVTVSLTYSGDVGPRGMPIIQKQIRSKVVKIIHG